MLRKSWQRSVINLQAQKGIDPARISQSTNCGCLCVEAFTLRSNAKSQKFDKLQKLREHNQLLNDLYPVADMIRNIWKCKNNQKAARLRENLRRLCLAVANAHKSGPTRTFAKNVQTQSFRDNRSRSFRA